MVDAWMAELDQFERELLSLDCNNTGSAPAVRIPRAAA
jgi:hypothetical protein